MLSFDKSVSSTEVIINVMRQLREFGDVGFVQFEGAVSATINGKVKVNNETIRVDLTNDHNHATIYIYWEDYGFKSYKDMGLFGSMNTEFQEVKQTGKRTFSIFGESYLVDVTY